MVAPEYLAGKDTDIPDDILKIMIDNYKKHKKQNFNRGTASVIDKERATVPANDRNKSM